MSLLKVLRDPKQFSLHVEMCPPRVDLPLEQSVEAWIDSNRLMRKITSLGQFVFLTDGAIGRREEPNLRHVMINLGGEADRARIIPILTTKHSLEYCLEFASRSHTLGLLHWSFWAAIKVMTLLDASNMRTNCAGSFGRMFRESRWAAGPVPTADGARSSSFFIRNTRRTFIWPRSFLITKHRQLRTF